MSDPLPLILIIEDELPIRRFLHAALTAANYRWIEAGTAQEGLTQAVLRQPDLVILDLGLPDLDGLEVIRQLRAWSTLPIIVLSARQQEGDKVLALDAGADDYLTKPFGAAELLARVRAQLRRRNRDDRGATLAEFGTIRVDLAKRTVERNGTEIHLTPIEYRLLAYLIANPDRVLTHRQLLKNVWGPAHVEDSHYVRIYMGYLRKKIEEDPARPKHILTAAGVGYRFDASRAEDK